MSTNPTTDPEDMSWARLLLADELEAKDAEIERLRSRVEELESEIVGALGAAGYRIVKEQPE